MKQNQERLNTVNHQPPRTPVYEEQSYEKDIYFVTNQMGGFHTNSQGSNQDYGAKVKTTNVKTLIGIMHIGIIIEVDITTKIGDKIKKVIGLIEIGIEMVYISRHPIMILGLVAHALRRCLIGC